MKKTIAKTIFSLQWFLILTILFFSTITFGGVHASSIFFIRLFIIASLLLQIILIFVQENYFNDFRPALLFPTFLFVSFLTFVFLQYIFEVRLLKGWMIGTVSPYATYDHFIQLITYSLFFFACAKVASSRELVERLGSLIAVLVFLITILGLAQRLVDERILWKSFSSTPQSFFGPFINENHFGGFLALTFPLALGSMHYRFNKVKRKLSQSHEQNTSHVNWFTFIDEGVVFLFFLLVVTLGACFFALARVAALVLLFCCIAYFVVYAINKRNAWFYLTLSAILVGAFALLQWLGVNTIVNAYTIEALWKSWSERFEVARQSLNLFSMFPFFGTGLGSYAFVSSKVVTVLINYVWWDHAHNDYVELLTDTGAVGFLLFMGVILSLLFISIRKSRENFSHWSRAMTAQAFIAIICIGAMELADFHLKIPAVALFFTLQLAILFQSHQFKEDEALPQTTSVSKNQAEARSVSSVGGSKAKGIIFKTIFSLTALLVAIFLLFYSVTSYRAYQLSQTQDHDRRLTDLKEAVELQPLNAELWFQLGKEYRERAKSIEGAEKKDLMDQAVLALRKATMLSPSYDYYWYYLGWAEYSFGFEKEAIHSLEESVYWAPQKQSCSLYLLAIYLRESKRAFLDSDRLRLRDKAGTLYRKLQRLETPPTESDYKGWMGDYYYNKLKELIPLLQ